MAACAGWVEVDVALGKANVGVGEVGGSREVVGSRSGHGLGSGHGPGELVRLGLGAESGPGEMVESGRVDGPGRGHGPGWGHMPCDGLGPSDGLRPGDGLGIGDNAVGGVGPELVGVGASRGRELEDMDGVVGFGGAGSRPKGSMSSSTVVGGMTTCED
ncbi:glycine-rich cell wall structural protein-like [Prunus avium]|uniref:Glycine-rich cell wall structural protein-like n=1 Tax=Prunus avium TaxID=42229 RepID=A0A6P5SZM4_PRUAV|nr:glycine-rich cell wall structural protein-like [Prunus avium]